MWSTAKGICGDDMSIHCYHIPVEPESKQLKIFGYARGNYYTKCLGCGQVKGDLDKLASSCRECAVLRYKRIMGECAIDVS